MFLEHQVLGWLHVIEAFQKTGTELPLNLKFCLEGMEESGSDGLDELLVRKLPFIKFLVLLKLFRNFTCMSFLFKMKRKDEEFLSNVDYCCISDNYWLGKEKPCITYGLRGLCYFGLEVKTLLPVFVLFTYLSYYG